MASKDSGTKKVRRAEAGKVMRVGKQGRVVLPVELREAIGVKEGDGLEVVTGRAGMLTVRVVPGVDLHAELAAVRREVRRVMGDRGLAEELVQERKREAQREGW